MWLQRCRSTVAYPGLAFGAGLLHFPMILPSEADQEQVTEVDRLIAVSIPVVNWIGLGSNHDQLWPVRKVPNITMGSLAPASLDGRSIVVSRADRDLSAWWGYILTSTHVKCESTDES